MALVYKDRVRQKASVTGTSNVTLGNPVASYIQFSNATLNNNSFPYAIVNDTQFEVGIGTYASPVSSSTTYGVLYRNTVLSNSNGDTSFINFSGNLGDAFITNASELSVLVSSQPVNATLKLIKWTGSQYELIDPVQDSSTLGASINSSIMFYNSSTTNYQADENLKFYPGATPELFINGVLQATAKAFKIKHPVKPGKFLIHGCLEGPEFGIYQRGEILTRFKSEIILPEYFTKISKNYTVNVTSNSCMPFRVIKKEKSFVIKNFLPTLNLIKYDFLIIGSRTDTEFELEA
jgi:hypothetical protein